MRLSSVIFWLIFLILLTLASWGISKLNWDQLAWYTVSPFSDTGRTNLQFLIGGLEFTIKLSLTAISISITVGLIIALCGLSPMRELRAVNRVYVELVRAVPVLVLIFWVYYGIPTLHESLVINAFWAGVIALAFSDSAFEAEIFRAGIQSIERGQIEAADSIGLGYFGRLRYVVLPQAIRRILPPLGNQLVYMLKMSSLVSVLGTQELTRRANELAVSTYRLLEIYSVLVLEYLVLIFIVSMGVRWLERRLQSNESI